VTATPATATPATATPATATPIPAIDQLDGPWFTNALRASGQLAPDRMVGGVSATQIGVGAGLNSFVWRVTLSYDQPNSAPTSVIVKMATDDPHRLFIAQSAKFYAREVRFYQELAADAPVRVPKCFHAEIDPETSMFILVIEDAGQLRHVDQLKGCGFHDAVNALRTIARFQAKWWDKDLTDLADTFIPMNDGFNQFVVPIMYQTGWPAARIARPDLWPEDIATFLDGYEAKIPQILNGIMGPNTLTHNDYRVDNLLFDGDEVIVLDFQLSSIASGLLDFTFFVAQSIPKEIRQERFDDLLDAYLGELAAHGIALDRDVAIDKYRRALVFGFLWPLGIMGGYDTLDPRGRELAEVMLDRHLAAARDVDALSLYP
jgi:Ecdysteroid kinase-like family